VSSIAISPSEFSHKKKSFKETQFEAREQAILDATNRLLGSRGYEMMSMDDIAGDVGIAKGSLYKHFDSKESLAAAVMVQLLRRTQGALNSQDPGQSPLKRLEALLRWILKERLSGSVPHLPSTSQTLRAALMANKVYVDTLMSLSEDLGNLIQAAKAKDEIALQFADEFVMYTFYARSCDPTLEFLRAGGNLSDEEIVDQMTVACFRGLLK
jgi:TetR/AcrR family transcriptional regulator, regulator of autoinduction and epiphytic fitness